MAYIIHYEDESNPGLIKEEIVLTDSKPDATEIEDQRPSGYDGKDTLYHISDRDWPSGLPLDRGLTPVF